jgi:phosphatidate cytidylyltransferase
MRRVLSSAVLIPGVVWVVAGAPSWVFEGVVVALSATAAWELGRLFQRAGWRTRPGVSALCAAVVTASFVIPGAPVAALAATTGVILASSLWTAGAPSADGAVIGLTSLCYVGVLMGHAVLLQRLPEGRFLLLFLFAVTWAGETAAYAVGSLIGRHKLAPQVSPGKTVEGAVAQLLASALAGWVAGSMLTGWSVTHAAATGLLLGGVGQLGDLTESAIKRSVGAKDAGSVIPGHGGLLDRIDGLLFNTPTLFYCAGVLGGRA